MPVQTIPELFLSAVHRFPRPDCFSYRDASGQYVDVSSEETLRRIRALRRGLRSLGVRPGDRVAILSENRLEWALSDLGTLCAGAVTVPIYATLMADTIAYILADCRPKVVFVSDQEQAEKIQGLRGDAPFLTDVICYDRTSLPEVMTFERFMQIGQNLIDDDPPTPSEDCLTVDRDAPCSVIYTSGTTGNPKGVVLSHWNFVSNIQAIQDLFPIHTTDKALSFLPLSHVLERMAGYYTMINAGAGIAFAQRVDTVPVDILDVKPTIMISVPRLYEKIYNKTLALAAGSGGLKKQIFFWARNIGMQCARREVDGRPIGSGLRFKRAVADRLVFSKLRAKLGGRIRFMVSGGAPLSQKINQFFYGAGLTIFEGYGLTETSPVISCNFTDHMRFGSVGQPITETDVRIAEDGEILVRGPQVMLGYYNNPEATAEVLSDDGWFATGDIGHLDEDGYLFITDRKKDLIVTAGGKNIAPQPIENRFIANRYVAQTVIIGDRRQFLTALIVPDFETVGEFARSQGHDVATSEDIIELPVVKQLFEDLLQELNRDLPGFSQIKRSTLLPREFTLEEGELTPTLKVKRFAIARKYQTLIDAMYPDVPSADEA